MCIDTSDTSAACAWMNVALAPLFPSSASSAPMANPRNLAYSAVRARISNGYSVRNRRSAQAQRTSFRWYVIDPAISKARTPYHLPLHRRLHFVSQTNAVFIKLMRAAATRDHAKRTFQMRKRVSSCSFLLLAVEVQERAVAGYRRRGGLGRGTMSCCYLGANGGFEVVEEVRVMAARASGGGDAEDDYPEEHFG